MAKDLEAVIRISGEVEATVRGTIEQTVKNIQRMDDASRVAAGAVDKLSDTIGNQSAALKAAKKQYASYVLSGEKSSEQAKELAKKIKTLSGELRDNKTRMQAAERAADKLAGDLDDVGDSAKSAGDGFTVMKGALADLVSRGIQGAINMAKDAIKSFVGLAESTQEYREDIGKLETAWQSAGKSTELATATYKQFYSVLGEEDRSVEAVNHLAKFVETEKDMATWTDIATGVWGTFGDSLPIEGLTEAANETAKTGKLTGVLADALNWVGVNEDKFQKKLDACNSEQERAKTITRTLNRYYRDAAKNYRENNASIIEARLATSDYTDSLAAMGEKIEPATTAAREGMNKVLEKILEIMDRTDFTEIADQISDLTDKAINLAENGIGWIKENANWLIPVISGLTSAFVAYRAITLGVAAAEAIKTAVMATGAATVSAATVATWALNGALAVLGSPITIAVAAIATLVAAVVWLYKNWDIAKQKIEEFGAKVGEVWTNISNWVTGAIDKIGQYFPLFGAYLSGWWESIQAAVENVKAIFHGIIDFISNVFSGNWEGAWDSIVSIFKNIFEMIGNLAKAPINGVISIVNKAISGINGIGFKVPDWVPLIGGKDFRINIPEIPMLASGGFTNGVSIAGEAGTEAVISFDPAYRDANLSYWAKAGRLLGATADDAGFSLSGTSSGAVVDMGGVTFAPNITIGGKADKESVIKAIEDEYPEFLDMLERWLFERGLPVYA